MILLILSVPQTWQLLLKRPKENFAPTAPTSRNNTKVTNIPSMSSYADQGLAVGSLPHLDLSHSTSVDRAMGRKIRP